MDAVFDESGVGISCVHFSHKNFDCIPYGFVILEVGRWSELFFHCWFDVQDTQNLVVERREERATPVSMNAFELISKSQGLNLSSLFETQMVLQG